jgi:hypothetical protein
LSGNVAIYPRGSIQCSSGAIHSRGGTANKPLRKLSPKQFCVDVEIPGKYSISILFDIGFSTNESSKDDQPEINKFMEREREILTLLKNEVEGEINVYRIENDKFVRKIKIPTENGGYLSH